MDLEQENNMPVAETHSEMGPVGEVPQAVAAVLLDEAGREPVAGYECRMCFQSSWNQR